MDPLPYDYLNPDWENTDLCHDWKNYIFDVLMEIWDTLSDEQKASIAAEARNMADREEWD